MDLFDYMREQNKEKESPLASRLRPTKLEEVVGQQHIIGKDKLLYRAIKADKLQSVIFYGPPGTGKTTLAKVIAQTTSAEFMQINATVYQAISKATNHGATILDGEGPYEHTERQVVYSVVSSAESKKVRKVVKEADPNAFINVVKTERLFGHFYYKPND